MDLTDMRTRCASRFRDSNFRVVTSDEWDDYINEAYRDVAAANPFWPFLQVNDLNVTYTAQATSENLPTDVFKVSSVLNADNNTPLVPLEGATAHIDAYPFADTYFDTPEHYRIYGQTIELYPRPAVQTQLSLTYIRGQLSDLGDNDEPAFPERYHHMLIEGALARAYEDDSNYTAADRQWAKFGSLIESMKDDLLSARSERYPPITDTWDLAW